MEKIVQILTVMVGLLLIFEGTSRASSEEKQIHFELTNEKVIQTFTVPQEAKLSVTKNFRFMHRTCNLQGHMAVNDFTSVTAKAAIARASVAWNF
jgi:hypothetical protein